MYTIFILIYPSETYLFIFHILTSSTYSFIKGDPWVTVHYRNENGNNEIPSDVNRVLSDAIHIEPEPPKITGRVFDIIKE